MARREQLTSKLAKWRRWLAAIGDDVDALVLSRTDHARARAALAGTADPALVPYLESLRAQAVALGIRRQLKVDSKSINLAGLILDLDAVLGAGDAVAADHVVVMDMSHDSCMSAVDAAGALLPDLRRLKDAARFAERYADRRLAHADKRQHAGAPAPDRLEAILDDVISLYRRAAALVDSIERGS